jgi:hypothetical protein
MHSPYKNRRSPQSKAEFFATKFDNNWVENTSKIRTKLTDDVRYDVTYSWEAKSDNPSAYSKLQQTELALQPIRPITMSGHAVIGLENARGLDVLNVTQNIHENAAVPLTASQANLGMLPDYSAHIPMVINAKTTNQTIVMTEPEAFRNYFINDPNYVTIPKPKCLIEAGDQCDMKLLTPAQRKEILDFEQRKNLANHVIRDATALREKLTKQMKGIRFHRGVIGVDDVENEDSEIYGERARRERNEKELKHNRYMERLARLSIKNGGMDTNGNILVPDTITDRVKVNKSFQSKSMKNTSQTFNETYSRMFVRVDGDIHAERTQHLREKDLNGKTYNFITHAGIEHWPVAESQKTFGPEHKILSHNSQASLEPPRNLQGTLRSC